MTQELGLLAQELSLPYYEDAFPAHDPFHAKRVHDVSIRLANDQWSALHVHLFVSVALVIIRGWIKYP